ncbi:DNA-methyltransferase [Collimonas sp. NPDC087041]|uniref:DNA-methyltransferase n=1 Tax=Collimonas sp. NPDC087041 TaxID=3363960 RepID=UPI0038131320
MSVKILVGDSLTILRTLPDNSVHCVVTSPPYWGLRDYGVAGQLGLESSPAEFIANMVGVFEEVRRVLRPDGTCWVNMGDSYATGAGRVGSHPGGGVQGEAWRGARGGHEGKHEYSVGARGTGSLTQPNRMPQPGLKPKDLCMMPHRLAIALQDAGWWVRQDIVWSKPNPMPESVRDRCTKAHEYIFLLTKSERYFYDAEAIKEPVVGDPDSPRNRWDSKDYDVPGQKPQKRIARGVGFGHGTDANARQRGRVKVKVPGGWDRGAGSHGTIHREGRTDAEYQDAKVSDKRNKRSVWTMATKSFAEAHFATFPPELPETCIKAGCPIGGVVLDPFFGAGTTGLAADRLQRECIGIELNPVYAEIARKRIQADSTLFADVRVAA